MLDNAKKLQQTIWFERCLQRRNTMSHRRGFRSLLFGLLTFSICMLPGFEAVPRAEGQAEQTIEILIRDSAFTQTQIMRMQTEAPTVIVLRNQDRIRHGFTSELFKGLLVKGEGGGIIAYGKGMEGFYIDPGKTLVLRFRLDKPGSYAFRCDLHPDMKGELYMLEVPTA